MAERRENKWSKVMRGGRCKGVYSSAPPQKTFGNFYLKMSFVLLRSGSFWCIIQGVHQRAVTDGISK